MALGQEEIEGKEGYLQSHKDVKMGESHATARNYKTHEAIDQSGRSLSASKAYIE